MPYQQSAPGVPTTQGEAQGPPVGVLPQAQAQAAAQAQAQGQLQQAQQAFAQVAQAAVALADQYPDCREDLEQAATLIMQCLAKVAAATQPEPMVPPA